MKHTATEENYLKAIFHLAQAAEGIVNTNMIASELGTTAASVTDMLKKLNEKELIRYIPYKGASLTDKGRKIAVHTIRKHRLWEVFLVQQLSFSWDNVHEVAEQLEHVDSPELVSRLDAFLGFPRFDPHGDPIPTEEGVFAKQETVPLLEIQVNEQVSLCGVLSTHPAFLQYLDKIRLGINKRFYLTDKLQFDNSLELRIDDKSVILSGHIAEKLLVKRLTADEQ